MSGPTAAEAQLELLKEAIVDLTASRHTLGTSSPSNTLWSLNLSYLPAAGYGTLRVELYYECAQTYEYSNKPFSSMTGL